MSGWVKSSCLLVALLVSCCFLMTFSAAEDQPQTDNLYHEFFHEGCKMEYYYRDKEMTITSANFSFHPVIRLSGSSSISVKTDWNEMKELNLTGLPLGRPMGGRFDFLSSTFRVQLSPLVSFNLTAEGVNDTIKLKEMTFKWVMMTNKNCTNGLPFYEGISTHVSPGERMELLLLSTQEGGDSAITGLTWSGGDNFYICTDGERPFIRKGGDPSCVFSSRTPHLLTLRHNSQTNESKLNDTKLRDFRNDGEVFFNNGGHYKLIICMFGCPTTAELNTPQGNVTKKVGKTCVFETKNVNLVVVACILFLIAMAMDVVARVSKYIHRRFFYQPPEVNPEDIIQWHLNVRPLPQNLQPPPPLPERPAPTLPPAHLRRRVVMVEEEEEDSD